MKDENAIEDDGLDINEASESLTDKAPLKKRARAFWNEHKDQIKNGGLVVLSIVGTVVGALLHEEHKKNADKDARIEELEHENELLEEENNYAAGRIVYLEERHADKDAWMDAVASEDLRLGGSLGGQVLASKKAYKREQEGE